MTYTINHLDTASTLTELLRKENVEDLIVNLFPLDTPLHQTLETVSMGSYIKTPVDTFNSGLINRVSSVFGNGTAGWATVNVRPEGHTYTNYTEGYGQQMISGVTEIHGKSFSVSDSDRNEPLYGMTDRFAYEAMKATEAVVNEFEHSFWWSPGSTPGGIQVHTGGPANDIARRTQGVCYWVLASGLQRSKQGGTITEATHNDQHGNNFGTNDPTLNTGAATWAYDANGLTLDKAMFKDNLMAKWYDLTGRQAGAMGFCGAKIKNLFTEFSLTANGPINERTLEAAAKRVIDTVDFYETDFGTVSLNLCRYLNISGQSSVIDLTTVADVTVPWDEILIFIQPQYFRIGVKRPVYMSPLGKTGDFESGLIRGEKGIICRNPQAGAAVVNCLP